MISEKVLLLKNRFEILGVYEMGEIEETLDKALRKGNFLWAEGAYEWCFAPP